MVVGVDDIHLDDGSPLVRCKDVPLAVRGAVGDVSVVLALKTGEKPYGGVVEVNKMLTIQNIYFQLIQGRRVFYLAR